MIRFFLPLVLGFSLMYMVLIAFQLAFGHVPW